MYAVSIHSSTPNRKTRPGRRPPIIRPTLTLPQELYLFARQRADEPEFAGNLSAYVRNLLVADKRRQENGQAHAA